MKKKNFIALLLVIFFLINIIAILIPVFVRAEDEIKIYYNDKQITSDVSPVIFNDRVLVPVRMIFEAIDAKVSWDANTKKVTIVNKDDVFKFTINSDTAYINNKKFQLDTSAKLISDRTFIPLRFLAENSGLKVEWKDKERSVYLYGKKEEEKEETDTKYNYMIDVDAQKSSIVFTFKNEEVTYDKIILEDPVRLVIDIKNCIKDVNKEFEIDSEYYTAFRYSQFSNDPMVSRIVVELNEKTMYEIETNENKLKINFFFEGEQKEDGDEEVKYEEPDFNKKYKTVVIDAGHGGKDPGALGMDGEKIVLKEKDVNLSIALKVYNKLKKEKVNVYMTRSTDEFLELNEIVEFANSKKADLLVSCHNNAAENTNLSGTMVMYAYDEPKDGHELSGYDVAKTVQKHLVKATKGHDFGPRKNSALLIIRKANMPAIITESLFITNENDLKKLMDEKYIENIADAIYKGICEVLEL